MNADPARAVNARAGFVCALRGTLLALASVRHAATVCVGGGGMSQRQAFLSGLVVVLAATVSIAAPVPSPEISPALGRQTPPPAPPEASVAAPAATPAAAVPPAAVEGMIERGAYLVRLGGCNDCHTPLKNGPNGPEPDLDRMLSGHPAGLKMPPPPELPPGPWTSLASETSTAFAGPWGVTYASNLTPDKTTGIGSWSETRFVELLRAGKHHDGKRPILPPMPWRNVARLTDDDLRSVHRYLMSLPPIENRVPEAEVASAATSAAMNP
jgi:mono/diheme cytochrome c family protein